LGAISEAARKVVESAGSHEALADDGANSSDRPQIRWVRAIRQERTRSDDSAQARGAFGRHQRGRCSRDGINYDVARVRGSDKPSSETSV